MTNEQILKKAIEKAEKNGYKEHLKTFPLFLHKRGGGKLSRKELEHLNIRILLRDKEQIIFAHEFAKAFWGTESIYKGKWKLFEWWQKNLQIMVLKEEPLRYLEKFL